MAIDPYLLHVWARERPCIGVYAGIF